MCPLHGLGYGRVRVFQVLENLEADDKVGPVGALRFIEDASDCEFGPWVEGPCDLHGLGAQVDTQVIDPGAAGEKILGYEPFSAAEVYDAAWADLIT